MACKLASWRGLRGSMVSPRATPNRRSAAPPREPNNSWEAGIWRDHRGMPRLDPVTLEPLPLKDKFTKGHLYGERPLRVVTGGD
jgi:hypothetical protein